MTTLATVEAAHIAAIEWIETRLGEVALGGPSALQPTPLQATAAVAQRVAIGFDCEPEAAICVDPASSG